MSTYADTSLVGPDAAEAFGRDGFVVVDGLLDADELDRFGTAVTEAVAARAAWDTRPLAEKSRYEQSFQQCMNLWEDVPSVRPLTFHPRIARAAAELLEVGAVRLWHDQALYKEAGGRATDSHQDQPYWPIAEPDTITAWIPFDEITHANGAMGYVPGSHRIGLRKFVNIFFGEPEDLLTHPAIAGVEPRFVEVGPGSVVFHHGLTAHLALANESSEPRRVMTMIYFADGCTRGSPHPHFAVDRPGIEVGQRIESDLTPIAWPRPAGDLPSDPTC
jgi:ectoine hydroxylase-related dioxygenase (phytanoyl-CoA dioxygenase family)